MLKSHVRVHALQEPVALVRVIVKLRLERRDQGAFKAEPDQHNPTFVSTTAVKVLSNGQTWESIRQMLRPDCLREHTDQFRNSIRWDSELQRRLNS